MGEREKREEHLGVVFFALYSEAPKKSHEKLEEVFRRCTSGCSAAVIVGYISLPLAHESTQKTPTGAGGTPAGVKYEERVLSSLRLWADLLRHSWWSLGFKVM